MKVAIGLAACMHGGITEKCKWRVRAVYITLISPQS